MRCLWGTVWGRVGAVGMAVMLAASCASTYTPHPTKEHPLPGCQISCVNVQSVSRTEHRRPTFRFQKRCLEGLTRQFQDLLIWGEDTARGLWLAFQGDYPKDDVILQSCDSYARSEQNKLDASQRGTFPGEDELGRSRPPK